MKRSFTLRYREGFEGIWNQTKGSDLSFSFVLVNTSGKPFIGKSGIKSAS